MYRYEGGVEVEIHDLESGLDAGGRTMVPLWGWVKI